MVLPFTHEISDGGPRGLEEELFLPDPLARDGLRDDIISPVEWKMRDVPVPQVLQPAPTLLYK
jgi:hypothetical protein